MCRLPPALAGVVDAANEWWRSGCFDDGVRTQAEFYRKVWGRGAAGADIPLRVLQGVDVKELEVHSMDRVDYFRPKTTY